MGVMSSAQVLLSLLPLPLESLLFLLSSPISGPAQVADAAFC